MTSRPSLGSAAQWVMRRAAWWKTRSLPATSSPISRRSRISPSTSSTRPLRSASARFAGRPRTMLSTATIRAAAGGHQSVDDVRADEPGAAGDQNALARQDSSVPVSAAVHRTVADDACRHAGDLGVGRNVVGDDGTGADDAAAPERHARHDHGIHADVRPVADPNRRDRQVGGDDRPLDRLAGMRGAKQPGTRPPADVLADHRSRASRNACGPIHVPAPITQCPSKRPCSTACSPRNTPSPISNVSGWRNDDVGRDGDAVAEATRQRAQVPPVAAGGRHSHRRRVAAVELEQTAPVVFGGQCRGQTDLVVRVGWSCSGVHAPLRRGAELACEVTRDSGCSVNRHAAT